MPEEWLTYREIGARLGLNVEAVRTRVRRAGWRTQPGNDGRTRVLVPVEVFVEPVRPDEDRLNEGVNRTEGLTGLVTLLTAAEARISRLETQLAAERDRVNEARSEADRLRVEVAEQTTQTAQAKQASTEALAQADTERARANQADANRRTAEGRADMAEADAREARSQTQVAQAGAEKPRVPLTAYVAAVFRYALIALIVYVIFKFLGVPLASMVVGMCALAAAAIAASVYELWDSDR